MANDSKSDRPAVKKDTNSFVTAAKATFARIVKKLTPNSSAAAGTKQAAAGKPAAKQAKQPVKQQAKPAVGSGRNAVGKTAMSAKKRAANKKQPVAGKKPVAKPAAKKPAGR